MIFQLLRFYVFRVFTTKKQIRSKIRGYGWIDLEKTLVSSYSNVVFVLSKHPKMTEHSSRSTAAICSIIILFASMVGSGKLRSSRMIMWRAHSLPEAQRRNHNI